MPVMVSIICCLASSQVAAGGPLLFGPSARESFWLAELPFFLGFFLALFLLTSWSAFIAILTALLVASACTLFLLFGGLGLIGFGLLVFVPWIYVLCLLIAVIGIVISSPVPAGTTLQQDQAAEPEAGTGSEAKVRTLRRPQRY